MLIIGIHFYRISSNSSLKPIEKLSDRNQNLVCSRLESCDVYAKSPIGEEILIFEKKINLKMELEKIFQYWGLKRLRYARLKLW